LTRHLAEAFSHALAFSSGVDRPSVVTVAHAGNWKAIYRTILDTFPNLKLASGTRHPFVFGRDEAFYLERMGPAGALQFKQGVRDLLAKNTRLFFFDTQKIECLRNNPGCMGDLLKPGHCAAFFFRGAVPATISKYLAGQKHALDWTPQSVDPDSISVMTIKLAAGILTEEYQQVSALVSDSDREVLDAMKDELFDTIAPELEDLFFESSFGAGKLREMARRRIAITLLRVTTPPYSTKSGRDPVQYFQEHLAEKFARHNLPVAAVAEIAPNLSFVVKSRRRFSELRLG
jgi:hypothetical protein